MRAAISSISALVGVARDRVCVHKGLGSRGVHRCHQCRPPASVPIWYDYTPGGNIRVTTGASRRKARLIKQAGTVTLVVQREEPPYQYVTVEATLVDVTVPTPLDVREAIAVRYLGDEAGRQFAQSLDEQETVLFTFRPQRWFTADYSE